MVVFQHQSIFMHMYNPIKGVVFPLEKSVAPTLYHSLARILLHHTLQHTSFLLVLADTYQGERGVVIDTR